MNKAQALQSFWSSFGIPAVDEQSAYDDMTMEALGNPPMYITYEVQTSNLGEPTALTASIWKRSTTWAAVQEKADEIAAYIGWGGKVLPIDGGYLWVKLRQPFAQRIFTDQDDSIRRMYLNISVDYLTAT